MYNSPTIELLGDAQMGEVMGAFFVGPAVLAVAVAAVFTVAGIFFAFVVIP